jgi:uroporphyrinogen III methyltransferase/synthase
MEDGVSGQGGVWLVGAGPGEADLISCRGRDLLERADVVLFDALSHPDLLEYCRGAELIDVGKRYGERSPAQALISEQLIEQARRGVRVVRLKGGDPMMFARGGEEALALEQAGIPFEIVPGITSPVAAAEFAGIPLTHRELSNSVTFITGSDREGVDWSAEAWQKLATATGTICVLMGMRRIGEIADAIVRGGRAESTPTAVVMWGARPEQRVVVGTLANIAERTRAAGLSNPSIIIVGEVVELRERLNWYEQRPLFGRRVLVPRPHAQAGATARALRERGAAAVVRPAIEIDTAPHRAGLDALVDRLGTFDWIVVTSANGVEALLEAVERRGADSRAFASAKLAAIGPRTAAAFGRAGLRADLVADDFVAEGLLDKLKPQLVPRARLLVVRAEEARSILPDTLRDWGAEVTVAPAYRTRPVAGEALLQLISAVESGVDTVLFSSSSMVDAVVGALAERAASLLARLSIICIGPITAATAAGHGLQVDLVSPVHTIDGTLDAFAAWLRSRRENALNG